MWLVLSALALAQDPTDWSYSNEAAVALHNEGVGFLNANDPGHAEARFTAARELDPTAAPAWVGLAQARLRQNDPSQAIEILQTVVEHHRETEVYVALSQAWFAHEDFWAAQQAAETAVGMAPASVEANLVLVQALLRLGSYEKAEGVVQSAEAAQDRPEWSCLRIDLLADQERFTEAESLVDRCEQATDAGFRTTSLGNLQRLSGKGPGSLDAISQRLVAAHQAQAAGESARAVELLTEILSDHPEHIQVRVQRGTLLYDLGRTNEAEEDLLHVFTGDTWVDVLRDGRLFGVVTALSERQMEEVLGHGAAVSVVLYVDTERVSEADQLAELAVARFGETPELLAAMAWVLQAKGKTDEAFSLLGKAVERESTAPVVKRVVAEMLVAAPERVPEALKRKLAESGNWRDHYNAAVGHSKAGEPTQCRERAERGLSVVTDAEGQARLGELAYRCTLATGNLEAAETALQALGGPSKVDAELGLKHVATLIDYGDAERSLELLEGLGSGGDPEYRRTLHCAALTETGQLDKALAITADPVAANVRAQLGYRLAVADRLEDAETVLSGACPELSSEAKNNCEQLLVQVRERGPREPE